MIIGLTGGIGSGKTTVSSLFAKLGIEVIDADIIARETVAPGSVCIVKIAETFGKHLITPTGELDRKALRKMIFQSHRLVKKLEEITHPAIRETIIRRLKAPTDSAYKILSSPLLIESNQLELVDLTIVVDISEDMQLERASARDNLSLSDIQLIIANQIDRATRTKHADFLIDNSFDLSYTRSRVDAIHKEILERIQTLK